MWSLRGDHTFFVNESSSSDSPAASGDLGGIIRLVRRICLYREQGDGERAARLQADELVSAVAAYRLWHGPDSLTEEKLCGIFVNETDHVREAMAIAAVVAPDLATLVPPSESEAESVFPPMRPLGSMRPFPDGPPAISELLDAMRSAEPSERRESKANEGRR